MKHLLFFFLLLIFLANSAYAQIERSYNQITPEVRYGLKLDLNRATLEGQTSIEPQMHWGIGLSVRYPVRRNFLLQPELSFSQRGAAPLAWEGQNIDTYFRYLDAAMLFTFVPIDFLHINAGGGAGLLLGSEFLSNGRKASVGLSGGDFSNYDPFVCGGLEFVFEPIALGARMNYSLSSLAASDEAENIYADAHHLWFQASIALLF